MDKKSHSHFLFGVFLLVLANVGFSSKAVIIKLMYRYHVDTFSVIALRMLISLPFYIVIAWWLNRREHNVRLTLREWLAVSGLGILSYYVSSMLDFLGLQYVTAGVERLTLYLYPTIVLILSAVFFKRKITPPQYIALGLTYLGVLLAFVAEKGLGEQQNVWLGGGLVFSAACTYSVYVVLTGEYVHKIGSAKFTCYAMMAATVPALIQSYLHDGMDVFNFPSEVYSLAMWMVLAATVIPTFLIVEGIRLVGANNSGIIGAVGPVSMIGLAYVFLGEQITFMQLLGTAIVLAGVFLITWKGKR
ncbi:MAG: DMT family transporter [Saprospiraceae bacterium]|nr:DMT family transporter [Saprospiraceae bacterium]